MNMEKENKKRGGTITVTSAGPQRQRGAGAGAGAAGHRLSHTPTPVAKFTRTASHAGTRHARHGTRNTVSRLVASSLPTFDTQLYTSSRSVPTGSPLRHEGAAFDRLDPQVRGTACPTVLCTSRKTPVRWRLPCAPTIFLRRT